MWFLELILERGGGLRDVRDLSRLREGEGARREARECVEGAVRGRGEGVSNGGGGCCGRRKVEGMVGVEGLEKGRYLCWSSSVSRLSPWWMFVLTGVGGGRAGEWILALSWTLTNFNGTRNNVIGSKPRRRSDFNTLLH